VAQLSSGIAEYAVASPDLWNRRQDSGKSGFEIMQAIKGMPPMISADDRRVAGWRIVREYLCENSSSPKLLISERCPELIRCMGALLCDPDRPEDASGEPHSVTHLPEALRYGLMSRICPPEAEKRSPFPFTIKKKSYLSDYVD
jgi:phage terminase large subunit